MLGPVTLPGRFVHLAPLTLAHLPDLLRVATDPRERYPLTTVPCTEAGLHAYIEEALALQETGMAVPFATCRVTGEILGSTRFANVERWVWPAGAPGRDREIDAVEIGWTWLSPDAQRTAVNTEAKLLMLGHAFEVWGVRRVNLKTDARNHRSRTAIARLGCQLDGVLRQHGPGWDGYPRDVALFSMLAAEWPAAKRRLEERLGATA